ncbi:uncharacterized protein Z518_09708 [Rhinocladiella mackenziei CBS 650.93]|uniref:UDP-N-acetylglucosamine transferase subunit ALG13 n=1 Tax=Rhinocladiella mackenziei CBS 650.93 TaxID=1442369 RepID=A0A0D2GQR3_9EURO|nr:uncharacterized protein Z518_09708 [Rhinocladiella mackenziei CBS 650.93]KIX00643.1 hypothetical protein Z518_09708 [Rhinocladiella mackenziei CBS 650.93]
MAHSESNALGRRCFVTIGATAPFNSLIKAVLEPDFIKTLQETGYTELRIQYGGHEGEGIFRARREDSQHTSVNGNFEITGFGFNKLGLREEMAAVKGPATGNEGVVISHAGSGSILDVLRLGIPLIVVPNTDLLHNHQVELAEILAEQDYLVRGKLE